MRKAVKIFLTVSLFSVIFGTNAFAQEVDNSLCIKGIFAADIEDTEDAISLAVKANIPVRVKTTTMDTIINKDSKGWTAPLIVAWKGDVEQTSDREFYIWGDIISADFQNCSNVSWIEVNNDSLKYLWLSPVGGVEIISAANLLDLSMCDNVYSSMENLDLTKLTRLECLSVINSMVKTIQVASEHLEIVRCYGNAQMTTQAYDDLMCQLPDVTGNAVNGGFVPLSDADDIHLDKILATNAQNAIDKGWDILYDPPHTRISIPTTTGTFSCNSGFDVVEGIEFSLYPNPAKDMLFVDGIEKEQVTIYDVDGRVVKQVVTDGKIDIKDLKTGVYAVEVKNVVKKFVVE